MKKQTLLEKTQLAAQHAQERQAESRVRKLEEQALHWKNKYEFACKELEANAQRFNIIQAFDHVVPEINMTKLKGSGESTAILACSDWHVGEVVDPTTVNGLNQYDVSIARKRVKAMFERAAMMIDVSRGLTSIKELVVWLGGDFISGALHDDQKETDEISPTESVIVCEDLITNGIRFLKKEAKLANVVIVTSFGNHGRNTHKPRSSTAHVTSYEQLAYWHLASTFKDAGVKFKIDNSYHNLLPIYGRTYRFHHGDSVRFLGGSGGLGIPVLKAVSAWDKVVPAYFDICGHFHQTSYARKYAINGSLVGYNAYAMRNKCEYEEPSQNLFVTSRKRGNILATRVFAD